MVIYAQSTITVISGRVERESAGRSSLKGLVKVVVHQTNIVPMAKKEKKWGGKKKKKEKLLRDGVERIWAFPSA